MKGTKMNGRKYKLGEFARLINVHPKTLQRYDRQGILVAHRTPTNRRYYTYKQYEEYINSVQHI